MSELQTLPAGDPQAGFIHPAREIYDAVGTNPEEQAYIDDRLAALEADTDRVLQAEHETVIDRESAAAAVVLKLASLIPDWCSIKDTRPVLLHVYGSGFRETAQIFWHDHLEETEFVDEGHLTTWVKPWLFLVPDNVLVGVEDSGIEGDQKLYFRLLP